MDKKSKSILGFSEPNKIKKSGKYFTLEERHFIVREYLSTVCTKRMIWEKYTKEPEDHGTILRWLRYFGYQDKKKKKNIIFVKKNNQMSKKTITAVSFETLQLQKRVAELERQLKDAEIKSIAFSTMIDIAESELKIKIRKKYKSKLSNK